MNIVSIIGTRPQFVKHATFQKFLDLNSTNLNNHCIHTGQHYDANMTSNVCKDFNIEEPEFNMKSENPGDASDYASIIPDLKKVLSRLNPRYVVLYGDTNST